MRLLHATDFHGTVKSPESRIDLYYLTFLRKLAELRYVIISQKIDIVLFTGDLFHVPRTSNKFMGQIADILRTYGVPIYVIPGNHDIDGYSITTIDQTSLGLLARTGVVNLLTRDNPFQIKATDPSGDTFTVAISGQEYYKDIDTGNMDDFDMQQPLADINILGIHGWVADTPQNPHIRCTYPKDIVTNADIILSGHYHRQFAMECNGVSYYNPGSALRVDMTEYNKTHMPCYGILDISLDTAGDVTYDYQFHQFRIAKPGKDVFDFSTNAIIKQHAVTLENFKDSLTNTMASLTTAASTGLTPEQTIRNVITQYCQDASLDAVTMQGLEVKVNNIYSQASQQTANEDMVAMKGFIPSMNRKWIKSVRLINFQSHEDTTVNFVDGLNIIIGESNQGKTSVFRAILWALNDEPSGTSFIMDGKDFATVIVTFNDDEVIERSRTRKDAGTFKLTTFNHITKQLETVEFKGFSNNIPIEIINAHQMPKISITKNIKKNLNVISQLDRPFLLTDSVTEKASAIGAITGTNVLDTAIKMNRSDITAENKYLKKIAADKVTEEEKLKAIPIKAALSLKDYYTKLQSAITTVTKRYTDCTAIKDQSSLIQSLVDKYTNDINMEKVTIARKDDVMEADQAFNATNAMLSLYQSYKTLSGTIQETNQSIQSSKKVIEESVDVKECDRLIDTISKLISLKQSYDSIKEAIDHVNKDVDSYNTILQEKDVIQEKESSIARMQDVLVLLGQVEKLSSVISNEKESIKASKKEVKVYKTSLKTAEDSMNAYVLSVGMCPCCGQKITDANISSIINNFSMEGESL